MLSRRAHPARRLAAAPLVATFVLIFAAGELSRLDGSGSSAHAGEDPPLVGPVFRATLPGGDTIDTRFVSDKRLRWKVVSGPRAGQEGTDAVQVARVGPGQYFVNRVETATGDTVSEVYDTAVKRVWSYRTRLDPEDVLNRHEALASVRLELIPKDPAAALAPAR